MQIILCKEYYAKNLMQEILCKECYAQNIMHRIVGIEYFANEYDKCIVNNCKKKYAYDIVCRIIC